MKCSSISSGIFALAATLSTAVTASPILERQTAPLFGITFYNETNFAGYSAYYSSTTGTCVDLGADINDLSQSLVPNEDSLCYVFTDLDCSTTGDFIHEAFPGVADLSVTPVNGPPGATRSFADNISSYFCVSNVA